VLTRALPPVVCTLAALVITTAMWHKGEQHTLRVFEKRVQRGNICAQEEVTGGCRIMHNDKLRDLLLIAKITILISLRRAEHVARSTQE
jgi:hypothetical protein